MTNKNETRALNEGLEVRTSEGGQATLVGYAAVFGARSANLGGFVEVVRPEAFERTLELEADVRALVNHDPSKLIGRSKAGTLRLAADEHGLRYEVDVPDTAEGRDLVHLIARGDITGSSFKFRAIGQEWGTTDDGYPERALTEVALVDVGPVTFPAYAATDGEVALRSLAVSHDLDEAVVLEAAEAGELRSLLDAPPAEAVEADEAGDEAEGEADEPAPQYEPAKAWLER